LALVGPKLRRCFSLTLYKINHEFLENCWTLQWLYLNKCTIKKEASASTNLVNGFSYKMLNGKKNYLHIPKKPFRCSQSTTVLFLSIGPQHVLAEPCKLFIKDWLYRPKQILSLWFLTHR